MPTIFICCLALLLPVCLKANYGFDVGRSPEVALERFFDPFDIGPDEGSWLRMRPVARHLPEDWRPGDLETLRKFRHPEYLADVEGLIELRHRGFKLVAGMVHLGGPERWPSGVRKGSNRNKRLPLDLREAYWKAFAAGYLYAGLLDFWEIENEPDIDFVADNAHAYASFHKAFYLGLKDGEECRKVVKRESGGMAVSSKSKIQNPRSKILTAPLAMPPGPYLETLSRNGIWAYTDGFNYHYYGYPEDFSGVYLQFEDAVQELTAGMQRSDPPVLRHPRFVTRSFGEASRRAGHREFPVFLTEYGYGYLSAEAAKTREGRLRQRKWYERVLPQIEELAIEGAMAFYLPPYVSPAGGEYGLFALRDAMEGETEKTSEGVKVEEGGEEVEEGKRDLLVTPALAAMLEYARENPYEPRHWQVPETPASPVVVDFIAGRDIAQAKSFGGYFLTGSPPEARTSHPDESDLSGDGNLVLYNLSEASVAGRLVVEWEQAPDKAESDRILLEERLVLPSQARLEVSLVLRLPAEDMARHSLRVRFEPDGRDIPPAVMQTSVWPTPAGMESEPVASFPPAAGAAEKNREFLQNRAIATGEPKLVGQGEWFVTPGVAVNETLLGWSFEVTALPEEPMRPAMAELPLPDDFVFEPGTLLEFYYRAAGVTAQHGAVFEPYFRTANGNLYSVWPRVQTTADWRQYLQAQENFTMAFHGRANLPWRFSENRPVALVFYLRPETLPFTLEVAFPRIVKMKGGGTGRRD